MKWPLGSGCATLTWAIINSESLQMNRDPIAWRKWELFPYHPGGECAGSENGSSVDCLTVGLIRSRDLFSGTASLADTTQEYTLLERTFYTGRLAQDQCIAQDPAIPIAESPAHLWATVPQEQERQLCSRKSLPLDLYARV